MLNYLRSNVLKKWDPTSNEWLFNTLWSSKPSKGPSNAKGKLSTKGAWGLSIMERPLNQPEDLTCCEFWKLSIPRLKTKLLGNRSRYIQIKPTLRTWLFHKGSWIHLPTKSESEWWFKNRTYVASLSRGHPYQKFRPSSPKMRKHTKLGMTRDGTTPVTAWHSIRMY